MDTSPLYNLSPLVHVMIMGLVIALGPLAWIWLRQALTSGKSLAEFAVAEEAPTLSTKKTAGKTKGRRARKNPTAKYRDAASGKTWSGRGRKPGWFVNALADGQFA